MGNDDDDDDYVGLNHKQQLDGCGLIDYRSPPGTTNVVWLKLYNYLRGGWRRINAPSCHFHVLHGGGRLRWGL